MNEELKEAVDRVAEIDKQMEELKVERSKYDALLMVQTENDLKNTKKRSIVYYGERSRVTAVQACTVKLKKPELLAGCKCKGDIMKGEMKYTLTEMGKRIAGAIIGDGAIAMTVEQAVSEIASGEKEKRLLKKVKGKDNDKDAGYIMAILGVDPAEAYEDAFFIAEAAAWEEIQKLYSDNSMYRTDRRLFEEAIQLAATKTDSMRIHSEVMPDVSQDA